MSRQIKLAYGFVAFLGAFLLFWIQPLYGRRLLPAYGGGAAIWSACVFFFQATLFVGYACAHVWQRASSLFRAVFHPTLLVSACLVLVFSSAQPFDGTDGSNPLLGMLLQLAVGIGLPLVALSSVGPIIQSCCAELDPGVSPYRLYALSNAGALAALLAYLFWLEPAFSAHQQTLAWNGAFLLFAALFGGLTFAARRQAMRRTPLNLCSESSTIGGARRISWVALPAMSSIALLSATNHLCFELAPSPFLWAVPLGLFLLSYVIAFDYPRLYRRELVGGAALLTLYLSAGVDHAGAWKTARAIAELKAWAFDARLSALQPELPVTWRLGVHCAAMFLICWLLHAELHRLRPAPQRLTNYYLAIALGGMVGGATVSFLAPLIFATYFEWKAYLLASFMLATAFTFVELNRSNAPRFAPRGALRCLGLVVSALAAWEMIGLLATPPSSSQTVVARSRNFYGTLAVVEERSDVRGGAKRFLFHGDTAHGMQYLNEGRRDWPTTYYGMASGVGMALTLLGEKDDLRIGVVGMGVGTLATYAKRGHEIRFYEIDPSVVEFANSKFTFVERAKDRGVNVTVAIGDARQSLKKDERDNHAPFDVLVLDAFVGDVIPTHLLTAEAFQLYFRQLADGGVIAVHTSNRLLNLGMVVERIAQELNARSVTIEGSAYSFHGVAQSQWVLLTRDRRTLESLFPMPEPPKPASQAPLWTDDHHAISAVMKP